MTQGIASGVTNRGSIKPEHLIAGEFPRNASIQTITGSGTLTQGTVLGRITTSGHYAISVASATDGSETPDAILAANVDLSGGEIQALVYTTGEFNELAITLGEGHTLDAVREVFRTRSVFLRPNQPD